MSLQDTIRSPKIDTAIHKLQISDDSLNVGNAFRTPIMQISEAKPAHLSQSKTNNSKPVIKFQYLSRNDSIFLNLIKIDNGMFQHKADFSYNPQSTSKVDLKLQDISGNEELVLQDTVVNLSIHNDRNTNKTAETSIIVNTPKARKQNAFFDSKDWLSGFIVLALIIAGMTKITAGKYINNIFSAVRFQQSANKLFSSTNLQNQKPGWALSALFVLNSSLLIFEYTLIFGAIPNKLTKPTFLLAIIGGILLYFGIKTILYRIVSYIFETYNDTNEYIFNADILSKAFGITILPIVSIIPFVDYLTSTYLLKAGLVLFLVMYAIQLLRGVKIILHSPLSIFYMFLYFCALEILPLSILIKLMIL